MIGQGPNPLFGLFALGDILHRTDNAQRPAVAISHGLDGVVDNQLALFAQAAGARDVLVVIALLGASFSFRFYPVL